MDSPDGFGLPELLVVVVLALLTVIPFWRILRRAGLNRYIALLGFVPVGYLVILGVLAFTPWRTLNRASQFREQR